MLYTTILFDVKKELGLSLREYIFLDSVFHLQVKTGWCYAKSEYFQDLVEVGEREMRKIKVELVQKGLLVASEKYNSAEVKTSERWNDIMCGDAEQKVRMMRTKKSADAEQKVRNTIYNKIDNKTNTSETESREEVPGENKPVDMIPLIIKEMESLDPKNKRFYGNTTQREACKFLLEEYGFDLVVQVIHAIPSLKAKIAYMPSVTTPVELRDKWVKIKDAVGRERAKAKDKIPEVLFA